MAYIGFDQLKNKIAARGNVRNPAAVAASIGRAQYGNAAMGKASALGRSKGHAAAEAFMKGLHQG